MADIKDQLIKDSYNYVLQSDLSTGVVYRIGGTVPVNPIFYSGLTINDSFIYSGAGEQNGYALLTDGTGYAYWGPISGASPSSGVTSITVGNGLSASSSTGAVTIVFTGSTGISGDYLPLSGGTVTGSTIFQSGLTSNAISATTYYNLPISAVTNGIGISASTSNGTVTITNTSPNQTVTISGGTNIQIAGSYPNFGVNYTGQTSFPYLPLSGGTVSGAVNFTNGLTANTISATNYYNLPYSGTVVGSGTSNYIPKWTGSTSLGDSNIVSSNEQVGINTGTNIERCAALEILSTTGGVLFPRMTEEERDLISSPVPGLIVYCTDKNEGLFIYKSSGWIQMI